MNTIKLFIIFSICHIFNITCMSQPVTEWIQRYNSPGNLNEDLIDMVQDKFGNTFITGNVGSPSDIITLKYNSSGNLLWSRIYNGPANRGDEAVKINVDDSGFAYVAGKTFNSLQFTNYLIIKYNPDGDMDWYREFNFGDSTTDVIRDMILDSNSNIYMTGYGSTCLKCTSDFMTIKTNKSGDLIWSKFFHAEGYFSNYAWTLAVDKSNRVIVSGMSADINNTYYNATVIYSSIGDLIRVIKYDSAYVRQIATDDSCNIYVSGNVRRNDFSHQYDIYLNKYDSVGKWYWNKIYNSGSSLNSNDYLSWLCLDKNHKNIYLSGFSSFNTQIGWDYLLLKYNSSGDSIWKRGYSPVNNSDNQAVYMAMDKFNNTYITGSANFNTPYYRFLTVKYDSAGNFIWAENYLNILFFNHYAKRVLVDSMNSVYVGGTSYSPESGSNDIVLIKYSQITQVQNNSLEIPGEFKLYQNYPNPFNPITNISYQIATSGKIKIRIINLLGKETALLVNENQSPGRYNIKWDASNFSSGMYFYNLEVNGNVIDTKKLILIK